jgi:hypothetical protein
VVDLVQEEVIQVMEDLVVQVEVVVKWLEQLVVQEIHLP